MKVLKHIAKFFVNPPIWFLIVIALIASCSLVGGMIIMTNANLSEFRNYGIACLILMGISVAYSIYGFIKVFSFLKEYVKTYAREKSFIHRLFTEYGFRVVLFSILSFLISLAFAVYNSVIAIGSSSLWFGALSVYYAILIILRGSVLAYHLRRRRALKRGQNENTTYIRDSVVYGRCGMLLMILSFTLSITILSIVTKDTSFIHKGISIYAFAAYAFYKIIFSSINYIKTRHTDEMTVKAINSIGLADAMVSLLALQTAMLKEFGASSTLDPKMMNAITGAVICSITIILGTFMIIRAHANVKKARAKEVAANNRPEFR